jgi:putative oxidoreductase
MLERSRPSSSGSTRTVLGAPPVASNPIIRALTSLEAAAGLLKATTALWFVVNAPRQGVPAIAAAPLVLPPSLLAPLRSYFLRDGLAASTGLLALRLAVGLMMIHHGQEKLADPAGFAANVDIPLHLPFPLLMAHLAGHAEVFGSWMVIFGVLPPLGALALVGTMSVAAYHHILTSGLTIDVLKLVMLYLGSSAALVLLVPGPWSFDTGIVSGLLVHSASGEGANDVSSLTGAAVPIRISTGS